MTATRKAPAGANTKSTPAATKTAPKRAAKGTRTDADRIAAAAKADDAIAARKLAVVPDAPAKPKRASLPLSERRNETTHADGAAAVANWGCDACGAKAGERCTAKTGLPTNHVHSARMKAYDLGVKYGEPKAAKRASRSRKAVAK